MKLSASAAAAARDRYAGFELALDGDSYA